MKLNKGGAKMGTPNVFEFAFNSFIGIGVGFEWYHHGEYGKVLDIRILLPFFSIGIFCRKVKENNWI